MTDTPIAPPRSPAARSANERREAARRTREWRDRVRVRSMADWALVQSMLDIQAEQVRTSPTDPGVPLTLRAVAVRGKATLVAAGFDPANATRAIAARIYPRGDSAEHSIPGPA